MKSAVEISNLSVKYENVWALSDINISIADGEFLGIIGPNGGGKTTLLKVILGLIKPYDGIVKIFEEPVEDLKKPIGYVPQFSRFDKHFPVNVMDVVLMGRLQSKISLFQRYNSNDRQMVVSLMKEMDIYDLRNRQIGQLSGGQLQRVLIARALAVQPRILLLDEPTASVDNTSKSQIYDILKHLNKDMTIIIVTHDIGAVSSIVNSIACINREIYYHGRPEFNNSIIQQVYGGTVELVGPDVSERSFKKHREAYNV